MNMQVNWELLFRYLKAECNASENVEFEGWLSSDEKHRKFFERVAETWKNTGDIYADYHPDLDKNWLAIEGKLLKNNKLPISWKQILRIAAVFIFIIGIAGIFYRIYNQVYKGTFVYSVTDSQVKELILSDGSKIWLNRNSKLIYPESFNKMNKRVAILSGEAFFEIAKNAQKPFEIYAGTSMTRVVGTSFYINTKDNHNNVTIKVNTGKVIFSCRASNSQHEILEKGEKAILKYSCNIEKVNNYTTNDFAWKTGVIYFENESLENICEFLSLYYNRKIMCNQNVAKLKLTAGFEKQQISQVVDAIEETLEIKSDSTNAMITFIKK